MINESEEWVDKLVVDMEETIENEGISLTNAAFHFDELDCKKYTLMEWFFSLPYHLTAD